MVKLCWAHGLYDAIFYVYNRGMRDYTTPLEVQLGTVTQLQKARVKHMDYHMLRDFIHEFLIPYRELASLQKTSNHLRKTSLHLRRPLERFGSSSEDRAIFRRHQDIFGRPRVVFGMRWQSFRYRWYLRMSSFDRRYCTIAKLIVCGIGSPAEQSCAMIGYPRGQDGAILVARDCPLPARHYSQ